jgi:hypothetical protein
LITDMCGKRVDRDLALPQSSIARVQASVLVPSMFIAHEPQMPSRHERRERQRRVDLVLDLDQRVQDHRPHAARSTSYVSVRGFAPVSGSQR